MSRPEAKVAAWIAAALLWSHAASAAGGSEPAEPELLGPLTRAEIESALPDWVEAEVEATPDPGEALRLASVGSDETRVTVYLGTWCSDSRRELARLWRALDEGGGEVAFELAYVGVSRDMDEPRELLEGVGLEYVPTFVVRREGVELGRIVEASPRGIEADLAALVTGDLSGVVTARSDLSGT